MSTMLNIATVLMLIVLAISLVLDMISFSKRQTEDEKIEDNIKQLKARVKKLEQENNEESGIYARYTRGE